MMKESFARDVPVRFESEPGPSDELHARILAAVAATPAPQMPLHRRLALAAFALPCAVAIAFGLRYAIFDRCPIRRDFGLLPPAQLFLELALLSALTLGATIIAVRPGKRGLGSPAKLFGAAIVLMAPAYFAAGVIWPLRADTSEAIAAAARVHAWGQWCAATATVIGLLALLGLTWTLRHAVPVSARLRGAALGAASGAWAGLALFVHCPASAPAHVLIGHVAPVAAFTVLGALTVPRYLRP